MARQKKLKIVDTIKNLAGEIHIMLDPNTNGNNPLGFCAEWEGRWFTDRDANAVKGWARKTLNDALNIDWVPVIKVSYLSGSTLSTGFSGRDMGQGVQFDATRLMVATLKTGYTKSLNWSRYSTSNEAQNIKNSDTLSNDANFQIPYLTTSFKVTVVYLHYTDDLWVGLCELEELMKSLEEKMESMLTTEGGLKNISSIGLASLQSLLPSGVEND